MGNQTRSQDLLNAVDGDMDLVGDEGVACDERRGRGEEKRGEEEGREWFALDSRDNE